MGIWTYFFGGDNKLEQNLSTEDYVAVHSSKPTTHEDETQGHTYNKISEKLRKTAITNESISMAANAYEKGVFGAGLSIQNTNKNDAVNDKVEQIIKVFSKNKNFEFQGRFHFNYWIRFMSKDIIREGGILVRKHRATPEQAKSRKWTLPYKVEMLEISSIDFNKNDLIKKIYNGVEVDRFNKPVKLWFKGGKSVNFNELIMYSSITRITQYNGVSPIYPSIPSIERQEDHAKSETENASKQAKVSDVYKSPIANSYKLKLSEDFEADLSASTKQEPREIDGRMPEGEAKIIDKDEEYTRLDRGSYTSAFDSLNKFANTRVAAGIGLTLDEYTQDLSDLTFHGGQVAQIKNDETYGIIRDDIVELVIDDFMIDMLSWCYITGYSDVEPEDISLNYIKKPRKSAQPSKDSAAWEKNLKNKIMTPGDAIKQLSGENFRDFEKRRLREALQTIETDKIIREAQLDAGLLEKTEPTELKDEK